MSLRMRPIAVPLCALACALAGCSEQQAREPAPQAKVEKNAVVFAPSSPQVATILSVPAAARTEAVVRFNGRLVWDEDRTVRVFSPLAGRVQSIAVRAGDTVKAGQPLAVLASADLGQAQSDARRAEQDHLLAQKNLARVEELAGAGVAPAKDLQVAQAELARAAAERARTAARLALYGAGGSVDQRFEVRAPIAGTVVERNLNPGQEVRPDGPPAPGASSASGGGLFVISDPSRLWFMLDAAEADLAGVVAGAEVRIGATVLGDERVAGRVVHVADLVDPQTRTVKLRGVVDNAARRLKSEMFVTAELTVPAAKGVLVPAKAVYLRGERYFLFVDAGGGRFVRRTVKLGPAQDAQQVVNEGVAEGEKVVTEGNLLLERLLAEKD